VAEGRLAAILLRRNVEVKKDNILISGDPESLSWIGGRIAWRHDFFVLIMGRDSCLVVESLKCDRKRGL
jgi:hypothetical protein